MSIAEDLNGIVYAVEQLEEQNGELQAQVVGLEMQLDQARAEIQILKDHIEENKLLALPSARVAAIEQYLERMAPLMMQYEAYKDRLNGYAREVVSVYQRAREAMPNDLPRN